ncbi:DUF4232 domain-containing protein [Actinospica durhamensis]|uniref:DUF4232 domain-containing protein n=1 Tax=Actinospica durhamensis TaxID=1508375 RepID=A0A941IP88_9ACTN|nr:DUF4232 domain-containing protein [Actinospica durhamensis]MBR7831718.1 DUF4232 domain-containing protein [Actinospica durhamensis]
MSERFDDLMAGLVDSAGAHSAPGPALARKRGRQRRTRQRLAASTLSLALLGTAGGVAATSLGQGHGTPLPTGHTGAAVPTGSASASASTPASPSPDSAPSTPAGASTSANPATSNPTSSLVPGTYSPGNWYQPTDLPLASSTLVWVPVSDMLGTRIGGNVGEVESSGDGASTNLAYFGDGCQISSLNAAPATEYEDYTGADNNTFLSTADNAIAADVEHLVYFYSDSSAASSAWNAIGSGFHHCVATDSGTNPTTGGETTGTTTQTSSAAESQCWSNVTTPTGHPAGDGTSDHACFVQQGNVIEAVDLTVNFDKSAYLSTVDYGTLDPTMVQQLTRSLAGDLHSGSSPVCGTGDLKITLGSSGTYSTNGAHYRVLVLTNISGSTCTVEGYPTTTLVSSAGKTLVTAGDNPHDPYTAKNYSQAQITLSPGATGSAILNWGDNAAGVACTYPGPNTLTVFAPDSATATSLGTLSNVCERPDMTPVQAGLVTP